MFKDLRRNVSMTLNVYYCVLQEGMSDDVKCVLWKKSKADVRCMIVYMYYLKNEICILYIVHSI